MIRKFFRKSLCLLCALVFIFSCVNVMPYASANSDQAKIDQYRKEQQELDKKIAAANAKIKEIQENIGKQEEYAAELHNQIRDLQKKIDSLDGEINIYQGQIDILNKEIREKEENISTLNIEIATLENEIQEHEAEINETKELLKERLITLYMQGETSQLELLLSSNSISNFLIRMELVENVTEHDTKLINEIRELATKLEQDKQKIEENKSRVEEAKQLVELEKAELQEKENSIRQSRNQVQTAQNEVSAKWNEVQSIIGDMESQSNQSQNIIAGYRKDRAVFEAQIQKLVEQRASTGSGATAAGFIAPLRYTSSSYTSSPYGNRSGGFHTGVDIPASTGTPIYAVKSGKVIISTSHYSYGNYVVIDHGQGVTTYYAHCSRLAVSVGQNISQGAVIGYVGSTGQSTGPHIHFEVRINGSHKNPANYIPLPRR